MLLRRVHLELGRGGCGGCELGFGMRIHKWLGFGLDLLDRLGMVLVFRGGCFGLCMVGVVASLV